MGWGEGGPKETGEQVSQAVNSCHRELRDQAERVKVCPVSSGRESETPSWASSAGPGGRKLRGTCPSSSPPFSDLRFTEAGGALQPRLLIPRVPRPGPQCAPCRRCWARSLAPALTCPETAGSRLPASCYPFSACSDIYPDWVYLSVERGRAGSCRAGREPARAAN